MNRIHHPSFTMKSILDNRLSCLDVSGDVASITDVNRVNFNGSFSRAFNIAILFSDASSAKSS